MFSFDREGGTTKKPRDGNERRVVWTRQIAAFEMQISGTWETKIVILNYISCSLDTVGILKYWSRRDWGLKRMIDILGLENAAQRKKQWRDVKNILIAIICLPYALRQNKLFFMSVFKIKVSKLNHSLDREGK